MKYTIADGFPYYAEIVENEDYLALFKSENCFEVFSRITEGQSYYRYAEDKWSLKQIIGHITDHERIMIYRILRFSRKDNTLLPGYDQDFLVDNSRFEEILWQDLLADFQNVRNASLSFIKSLSPAQLLLTGKAWKYEMNVEEFLKATIGHELHHFRVLEERYLPFLAKI